MRVRPTRDSYEQRIAGPYTATVPVAPFVSEENLRQARRVFRLLIDPLISLIRWYSDELFKDISKTEIAVCWITIASTVFVRNDYFKC
ncbi:hypothetical protein TNCV_2796291 [Trichonephila clavipes]|nr:hypothetical protein TNCV_2796291 [Trichonephila clavipes]